MKIETYDGIELNIFDMYGVVDIRTIETDRIAQIFCENREWQLHLYWIENGEFAKHFEILTFDTKPATVVAGKEWVVNGIR